MTGTTPIPIPIPIPPPSSSLSKTYTHCSSSSYSSAPPDSGYATRNPSTHVSLDHLPKSKISIDTADPAPPRQHIPKSPIPGREDLHAFRVDPEQCILARYREILPEMQSMIQQWVQSWSHRGGNILSSLLPGGKSRKSNQRRRQPGPVAIRLMIVGLAAQEAKPTIVVFVGGEDSNNDGKVKGLEGLMRQTGMRMLYWPDDGVAPNFEVLVIGEGPRKRYSRREDGEDGVVVVWDGVLRGRDRGLVTYCGTRIRFEAGEGKRSAVGTLGGLVKLVGEDWEVKVVGITAGHVLEGLFEDEDEGEEEVGEDRDMGISLLPEEGERYHLHRRVVGQLVHPAIPEEDAAGEVGDLIPARDWALFELDDNVKLKPNILERPGVDWEQQNNGRTNRDEITVAPPDAFPSITSSEVAMLSQSNSMRGVRLGELSHLAGGFMLSPEKGFVEAYLLKLDEGEEIQDGDSGAWVINPVSKEVYGHVVATDYTGDAYVIPLHAIFSDMKRDLGVKSVGLPTTADLLNIALRATTIAAVKSNPTIMADPELTFERQARDASGGIMTARACSRERHMSDLLTSYYGAPSGCKRRSLLSDVDSGYGSPGSPVRPKAYKQPEEEDDMEYFSY
ncbi:hypothetical protein QBC44DRAFT_295700 [Cladorrhinum sp. PSN332]|nr:hypothetical protein QBC44DRAFT_295700 [Cladorrhinum sp. PSN332]